jgi:hypothetical protein
MSHPGDWAGHQQAQGKGYIRVRRDSKVAESGAVRDQTARLAACGIAPSPPWRMFPGITCPECALSGFADLIVAGQRRPAFPPYS